MTISGPPWRPYRRGHGHARLAASVVRCPRIGRLSIDMPASLHRRFKLACAAADKVMVAEVLAFIERRIAELERS
jgi:hypothetical protein